MATQMVKTTFHSVATLNHFKPNRLKSRRRKLDCDPLCTKAKLEYLQRNSWMFWLGNKKGTTTLNWRALTVDYRISRPMIVRHTLNSCYCGFLRHKTSHESVKGPLRFNPECRRQRSLKLRHNEPTETYFKWNDTVKLPWLWSCIYLSFLDRLYY